MTPVALVTGGARRVGAATALALAKARCALIITYRTSADEARETAARCRAAGAPEVTLEELELSDLAAVEAFGARVATERAALDILVHNASVYKPSPLVSVTGDELLASYRVNAAAPLLLTRRLAPLLARSTRPGGGSVVAMCDIHAMGRARKGFYAYAMSKAALVEMVRALAVELAPRVRVNGVAPGVVAFPEQGYESDPAAQAAYLKRVPLGRSGTPEDAAEVVRWLAMDAHYTTGEIVRVDGGRWLS